jgi:YD repeat-containing protein
VTGDISKDLRYQPRLNFVYNSSGNVVEQQKVNDVKEVYLWGYEGQYPVAKILNSTYSIASTYITQSVLDNPSDDATLRSHLANLRNIPGTMVTTYTYKPLVGMTSQTDPAGRTIYYEYDSFNRLKTIRDQDGKVIKTIDYQYQQTNNQ